MKIPFFLSVENSLARKWGYMREYREDFLHPIFPHNYIIKQRVIIVSWLYLYLKKNRFLDNESPYTYK